MKHPVIQRNPNYHKKNTANASTTNELNQIRSRLFKKYFPKYLKELSLLEGNYFSPSTDPKIFFKAIKRTKILYNPSSPFIFHRQWKLLFGNKRKCIQDIHHTPNEPLQKLVQRVKYFPRLQSLSLHMPPYSQKTGRDNQISKRVVLKLTKVKRLDVKGLSQIHENFIEKLDSSPKFLSSLEKLQLTCEPNLMANPVLEIMRKKKTLLEHIASLVTNSLRGFSYCKSFQMLGTSLPNLESLQLNFSYDCYKFVNYLGAIGTFKNLKTVTFEIKDIKIFVRDFVLPSSVKSLRLYFYDDISKIEDDGMKGLKWKEVKSLQLFTENKTLVRFYENFDCLKGLENLEMKFRNSTSPEDYKCLLCFSEGLFKRVSSLKSLVWLSPWSPWDREGNYGPLQKSIKEVYFPQILSSLRGSSKTLESLEIGHDRIIFSNLDFSGCHGVFTKLRSVKIIGKVEDNEGQISRLLNEVISLGEEITSIELRTVLEGRAESLLSVLEQLKKLEKPNSLKIELGVRFSKGEDLEEVGCENVMAELKKEGLRMEGVSLTLFTKVISERMGEFLRMYGERFESFQNLPKFLGS